MAGDRWQNNIEKLTDKESEEDIALWENGDGTTSWQTYRQIQVWLENDR